MHIPQNTASNNVACLSYSLNKCLGNFYKKFYGFKKKKKFLIKAGIALVAS